MTKISRNSSTHTLSSSQAEAATPEKVSYEPSSKLWCHTIGRISCAVRTPFYGITAFFVLTKMALKLPWSIIQGLLNITIIPTAKIFINLFIKNPLEQKFEGSDSWSFTGMTRDLIALANTTQRMFNSIWLTIVAPPEAYRDLKTATDVCISTLKGKYHTQGNRSSEFSLLLTGLVPPNYIHQISPKFSPNTDYQKKWSELNG